MLDVNKSVKCSACLVYPFLAYISLPTHAQENLAPFYYDTSSGDPVLVVEDSNSQALMDALKHPEHHPIKISGTFFLDLNSDLAVTKRIFSTPDPECLHSQKFELDQLQKVPSYNTETESYLLTTSGSYSDECPSASIINMSSRYRLMISDSGALDNIGFIGNPDTLEYKDYPGLSVNVLFNLESSSTLLLGEFEVLQRGRGKGARVGGKTPSIRNKDKQHISHHSSKPVSVSVSGNRQQSLSASGSGGGRKDKKGDRKDKPTLDELKRLFLEYTQSKHQDKESNLRIFQAAYRNATPDVKRAFFDYGEGKSQFERIKSDLK